VNFSQAFNPIRSIRTSWQLLRRSPLPLGIGALTVVFFECLGGHMLGRLYQEPWPWIPSRASIFPSACVLISFLCAPWLTLGYANVLEKSITRGRAEIADLFDTRGRYAAMVGTYIVLRIFFFVSDLPIVALSDEGKFLRESLHVPLSVTRFAFLAEIVFIAALTWVWLGIALWTQVLVFEGGGPWSVMRRSWQLVRGHRLRLIVFLIAVCVTMVAGVIGCIVGALVTISIAHLALYESYWALTRSDEAPASSTAVITDPPPTAVSTVAGPSME
jgi:hypothetical protein